MDLFIILGVFIILAVAVWYIVGLVAKGLRLVISSLLLIILFAFVLYLYWDATSLQTNFGSQPKLFVYTDQNQLLAGFDLTVGTPTIRQDLTRERNAYAAGDLEQLKGSAYKLLIFNRQSFANVTSANLGEVTLTHDQALDLLASSNAKKDYVTHYTQQNKLNNTVINDQALVSDDNVKGLVFAALVSQLGKQSDITLMTRTGAISIYPETLSLKLIRLLPDQILPYFIKQGAAP